MSKKVRGQLLLSAIEDAKFSTRLQNSLAGLDFDTIAHEKSEITQSFFAQSPEKVRCIAHELVLMPKIRPKQIQFYADFAKHLIDYGALENNFRDFREYLLDEVFHPVFDWREKVPQMRFLRILFLKGGYFRLTDLIARLNLFPSRYEDTMFVIFAFLAPEIAEQNPKDFDRLLQKFRAFSRLKKRLRMIRAEIGECYESKNWDTFNERLQFGWTKDSTAFAIINDDVEYFKAMIEAEEEEEKKEEPADEQKSRWVWIEDTGINWDQELEKNPLETVQLGQIGPTLIQMAALYGSQKVFNFLVKEGAFVTEDIVPFVCAGGRLGLLRDVEHRDISSEKGIPYAVEYRWNTMLEWLGNSKDAQYEWIRKEGFIVACETNNVSAILMYIRAGVDSVSRDDKWRTPIHIAAMRGHMTGLRLLGGSVRCDPNAVDDHKMTPLHHAAQGHYLDAMRYLIIRGADPSRRDVAAWTALHYAVQVGHKPCVDFLIAQRGVNMNAKSETEWTPVHVAAAEGHLELMEMMYDLRADIFEGDKTGMTPLHIAAKYSHLDVVKFLVSKLCDVNAKTKHNQTVLDLATDDDVRDFLKDSGAIPAKRRGSRI